MELINGLSEEQLKVLRAKLLDERRIILEGTAKTVIQEDRAMEAVRMAEEADQAEHENQQAMQMRFRNREILYLKKIEQALDRIESNTYGVCKATGEDIGFKRLLARPTAELSLEAKENQERIERQSYRVRKSLGRQIRF